MTFDDWAVLTLFLCAQIRFAAGHNKAGNMLIWVSSTTFAILFLGGLIKAGII